jgi:5'-deoxynucleotidase YfbR-like HD superfamily hydrolase
MKRHDPTVQRIAELQQFIADFGRIERVPQLADLGRAENDIEHTFGLALTCWFLAPKIAPHLNLEKIFRYALAHDTVEIYAGDTFSFGEQHMIDSKSERENEALKKLAKDWPDFTEMVKAAANYKNHSDQEAKFVYAVDKMLPVLMVNLGEKDKFWNRHKITREMQAAEKQKMLVSDMVAPYYDRLMEWTSDPDYYYKPVE